MRLVCGLLTVTALGVLGCGQSDPPMPIHPVKGQVLYDGKPAEGVQVFFIPTGDLVLKKLPGGPHAVTAKDGSFELTTVSAGDGAPEGTYQVVLLWRDPPKDDEEAADVDKLMGWYSQVHSKLKAEVKPGSNVIPAFKVPAVTKPPGEVQGIPGKN
jgi:hypothetical protein